MTRNIHLFVSDKTQLSEVENVVRANGDRISYLKIASKGAENVDIAGLCNIVRGTAIMLCLGGGIAEIAISLRKMGGKKGKTRFDALRRFATEGVRGIEIPVKGLDDAELMEFADQEFGARVVEIGEKKSSTSINNRLSVLLAGVESAKASQAHHVVLEGSAYGNTGVYLHDTIPRILVVDEIIEQFEPDTLRCIIESPQKHQQDLWRILYGDGAHLGNVYDFKDIDSPPEEELSREFWGKLREFRLRLKKLVGAGVYKKNSKAPITWDSVSSDHGINHLLYMDLERASHMDDQELFGYFGFRKSRTRK